MFGLFFRKTSSNFVNRCFHFLGKLSVDNILVNASCYLTRSPFDKADLRQRDKPVCHIRFAFVNF